MPRQTSCFLMFFIFVEHLTCQYCAAPGMFSVANISCVSKFCYQSVYCFLIWYFLVRIHVAKCFTDSSKLFWCIWCLRMNTHLACDYTMFSPAQPFCSWCDQRSSKKDDLDSSVMGVWEKLLYRGGPASDFIFVL
jgi:hypothetical protein